MQVNKEHLRASITAFLKSYFIKHKLFYQLIGIVLNNVPYI